MARWNFINNPTQIINGAWEGSILTPLPDFTAFPGQPHARMSIRIEALGTRPGYDGPIGRLTTATIETGVNALTNLQGSEMVVMPGQWYHSASQVGGLGDYIWTVPRQDWPLLGFAFWSNGRASGGTWQLRLFEV